MAFYKMPVEPPIECFEEEMEELDYHLCLVDQKVQNGELTEEEAEIEKEALNESITHRRYLEEGIANVSITESYELES